MTVKSFIRDEELDCSLGKRKQIVPKASALEVAGRGE